MDKEKELLAKGWGVVTVEVQLSDGQTVEHQGKIPPDHVAELVMMAKVLSRRNQRQVNEARVWAYSAAPGLDLMMQEYARHALALQRHTIRELLKGQG